MTVQTTTTSQSFAGGQSVLTFTFRTLVSNPNYISVNAVSGSVSLVLTYGTNYSVVVNSSGVGGTVTVSPTYSNAYTYVVYRSTGEVQSSSYSDFNQFPASTLENGLDQLTMIVQEQSSNQARTLSLPIGASTSISTTLPFPLANYSLAWDPTATFIVNTNLTGSTGATGATGAVGPSGATTTVSSSTTDATVITSGTTYIISAINAATSGSNTILRLDSTGKLPTGLDGSLLINVISSIKNYGSSLTSGATVSLANLKIVYGNVGVTSSGASVTNLPFSSSTTYFAIVIAAVSGSTTQVGSVNYVSGSRFDAYLSSTGDNGTWIAIGY